ncbi:MAG: hypothetical protein Q4Q07_04590 [Tissierellia bacterium]|nr:hypothetical protein [Tissierellia bacterium]
MNNVLNKIAYLKGLADGLEIGKSKEGNILINVIETLEESVTEMYREMEDLSDYVDAIEQDLSELEGFVFGDDFSFDTFDYDDYDDFDDLDFYDDFDDFDCCEEGCDCDLCDEELTEPEEE